MPSGGERSHVLHVRFAGGDENDSPLQASGRGKPRLRALGIRAGANRADAYPA